MIENIFHIYISDGGSELPAVARKCLAEVQALHPGAAQHLFDDAALRVFLAETFEPEVLAAYDLLRPFAYKADLARYCLIYARGGLYADLTSLFVRPLPVGDGTRPVLLCCPGEEGNRIANTIFYAPAGRPEFKAAIDSVVAHCGRRFYGANPLCPTGPQMLGDAVRSAGPADDIAYGEALYVSPGYRNACFLDPAGDLFAVRLKRDGGDLAGAGFAGVNNYNDFWHERRVYGETDMVWEAGDPQLRCAAAEPAEGVIRIAPGRAGCQTFGPYVRLAAGRYEAVFAFAPQSLTGRLTADITTGCGAATLAAFNVECAPGRDEIRLAFQLDTKTDDVEVRLFSAGNLQGDLTRLTIRPLD